MTSYTVTNPEDSITARQTHWRAFFAITATLAGCLLCGLPADSHGAAMEPATSSALARTSTTSPMPPILTATDTITSRTPVPGMILTTQMPRGKDWDPKRPTRVIVFALPNGNSTDWTMGRRMTDDKGTSIPGLDWHYDIQHIAAQTRRVRELCPDQNVITVYAEADGKSWPSWRKQRGANGDHQIFSIVTAMRDEFAPHAIIDLTCHSGGGSFLFGFINGSEQIPDYIHRIAFLDANYGYDDELHHGDKLEAWLKANPAHHLVVLSYDDRNITVNGKLVVSATGGTYRSTSRMSRRFEPAFPLTVTRNQDIITSTGLDGRLEMAVHLNPENKILHTVLVEKNGFVYAAMHGLARFAKEENFYGPQPYRRWVY